MVRPARAVVVLACGVVLADCTCTTPNEGPPVLAPRELARWDFDTTAERGADGGGGDVGGVSLWPRAPGAPERRRHAVKLAGDAAALEVVAAGGDPQLRWQFEHATPVWVVRADLETATAGDVQLFWTSVDCPVFAEACSTVAHLSAGRAVHDPLLPPTRGNKTGVRALRLDTPEGSKVVVHRLVARDDARMATSWRPRDQTTLEVGPEGSTITSSVPDPGIVIEVPGLDAEAIGGVEIGMTGPPFARPQVFWRGAACPNFSEECSVVLVPDGAEAGAWRGSPSSSGHLHGRIDELRIDPGDVPAKYLLHRIVLVRAGR